MNSNLQTKTILIAVVFMVIGVVMGMMVGNNSVKVSGIDQTGKAYNGAKYTKQGVGGTYTVSTAGNWSLPVCAVATTTCPGYGWKLRVYMHGAGGGSASGAHSALDGGGAGAGAGGNGGFLNFEYVIPLNNETNSFYGTVGAGGVEGNPNMQPMGGKGGDTIFNIIKNGVSGNIAKAKGGWGSAQPSGSLNGGPGATGGTSITNPNWVINIQQQVNGANGGSGSSGNTCTGGSGGIASPASYGMGGNGGHGGFRHVFPECMAHNSDYGLTGGSNGQAGNLVIQWL